MPATEWGPLELIRARRVIEGEIAALQSIIADDRTLLDLAQKSFALGGIPRITVTQVEAALAEVELWNKTAASQLDSQLRDRRRNFSRRLEAGVGRGAGEHRREGGRWRRRPGARVG